MIFLYILLREISTETSDPDIKDGYSCFTLMQHVCCQVIISYLELLMAIIAIDVVAGSLINAEAERCFGVCNCLHCLEIAVVLYCTNSVYRYAFVGLTSYDSLHDYYILYYSNKVLDVPLQTLYSVSLQQIFQFTLFY